MFDSAPESFAAHFIAIRGKRRGPLAQDSQVEVRWSSTLDLDLNKVKKEGYSKIGQSDVLSKASAPGPHGELTDLARGVGAELVLFCVWPAKLKSVTRGPKGDIDLWALIEDPPASFSPKSYAVTRALFLARLSDARET